MEIRILERLSSTTDSDALIVPFWHGKKKAEMAYPCTEYEQALTLPITIDDFSGKMGEITVVYTTNSKYKRLILLGLGEKFTCTQEILRRAYSFAVKMCHTKLWKHVSACIPKVRGLTLLDATSAILEGIALTNYLFLQYKTVDKDKISLIKRIDLIGTNCAFLPQLEDTISIIDAVYLTRDLVNGNADDVTPEFFANVAIELAEKSDRLQVKVLNTSELKKLGLHLLLAVGRNSAVGPRLLIIEYNGGPKSAETTLLVGKGVTFDTGGLNLKPSGYIETMRADMAGGAAVLGTMQAIDALCLPANIVGIIPLTENAAGSRSYKPGDVYSSFSGKSVEIGNTDAEGRLILADAVSYGQQYCNPTRIIDIATLTGAIGVALGEVRSGLFSNNQALIQLICKAGERTGEKVWSFPMDAEYAELLKSKVADINNCSKGRLAGSITGAKFIEFFLEKPVQWAHLDIAYTGFMDTPKYYHTSSATGTGVRLLVELIRTIYAKKS